MRDRSLGGGTAGTQQVAWPVVRRGRDRLSLRLRSVTARAASLRGGGTVMVATLVWHASNFTFNVVAARGLTVAQYGDLAAVVALLYIASPLFVSVQTVSSRVSTTLAARARHGEIRCLARYYGTRLGLLASALALALAAVSTIAARALHIGAPLALVVVAASLPLAVVVHLQRGVFLGLERFGRFSVSTLAEATTKVVTAVVLVEWIWPSVPGAVVGMLAGLCAALLANLLLLRFLPRSRRRPRVVDHPYRYSLATAGSLSLLALLLSLDVVAAKRFLPPREAGLYAAVSLGGKVVFFATSGINWIVFPRFSRMIDEGRDPRRLLARGFALIAVVGGAIATAYLLDPHPFVTALFGDRYPAAGRYLGVIAIGYVGYCVAYLGAMYLLAARSTRGIAAFGVAVAVQLTGFILFHASVSQIVGVQAGALCFAAVAVSLLCTSPPPRLSGART